MKGSGLGTGTCRRGFLHQGTLNAPNWGWAGRALTRSGHSLAAGEGLAPLPGPLWTHSRGHEVAFTLLLRLAAVHMPPVPTGHISGQKYFNGLVEVWGAGLKAG